MNCCPGCVMFIYVACLWMCVLIYSISLSSVYMCVRMPLSSRSIAEVPSSRALPGFPITAQYLCAFLL